MAIKRYPTLYGRAPCTLYTTLSPNPQIFQTNSGIQAGKAAPKWGKRESVGIDFGQPPHTLRNVTSVLDRTTGLVSPHFRVPFNDSFHRVK